MVPISKNYMKSPRVSSHLRMYQVFRENWSDNYRYRGPIIQELMGSRMVVLGDPLCNHSLGFGP